MNKDVPDLLSLWDYAWCDYHQIALPPSNVAKSVIREYLRSDAFGNPFVYFSGMSDEYKHSLHGPFFRNLISDFELISIQRFEKEIDAIRHFADEIFGPLPEEKWQPVRQLAFRICERNSWIFMLRLTEENKDRFHECGWVLDIFREFVFANPNSEIIERLVFGWD